MEYFREVYFKVKFLITICYIIYYSINLIFKFLFFIRIYFNNKKSAMGAFYEGVAPTDWLQQTPIQWIIYGSYEKEIAPSFMPEPDLELVYKNETITIYKVRH